MRSTSLEAFDEMQRSGALRGQLQAVARAVAEYGPGTSAEILVASGMDVNRNLKRARFVDLRDRGVIAECGTRPCKITGRRAIVFTFSWTRDAAAPARAPTKADWRKLAVDALRELVGRDDLIVRELNARYLRMKLEDS